MWTQSKQRRVYATRKAQGRDKRKVRSSLPGSLLLLLPSLPLTRSRWQGPHRRKGMSAMRTREKGDMEVSHEPLLGGRARAALQRLWHMGPPPCMYHGPTTTPRGWKPPGHGTGSANCCCSALGSSSTHSRAWLQGGGSRERCQHVATLQREGKPSEFGPCQPIPRCLHQL